MARNKTKLTADELLYVIKRSSLPTLLVEGDDDVVVFRRLEEIHCGISLSIMQSGGRSSLLKVFERKNEVSNVKLGFIADLDCWVVDGIPDEYIDRDLVFTKGYSIENDLFVDGDLINMISADRRSKFILDMENFVEWFALEVNRSLRGDLSQLDLHISAILDNPSYREERMKLRGGELYPIDLQNQIKLDYVTLLRGKNLLELALRHLTHNGNSIYQALGLMQTIAHRQGPAITRIFNAVALLFSPLKNSNSEQLQVEYISA